MFITGDSGEIEPPSIATVILAPIFVRCGFDKSAAIKITNK
jgi:hypothetical protein